MPYSMTFGIYAIRVTSLLDETVAHGCRRGMAATVATIIERGRDWDEPFLLRRVDIAIRLPWAALIDRRLLRTLARPVALEFWTRHVTRDREPVDDYPWIRWVFPNVTFRRRWRTLTGSTGIGPARVFDGQPDENPIELYGYWKTMDGPPGG